MRGVALLIDTIDKITDRLNPRLQVDGILATMYDGRTCTAARSCARVVDALRRPGLPHRHQPHREVPRRDARRRADHDVLLGPLRCQRLPPARPRAHRARWRGLIRSDPMTEQDTVGRPAVDADDAALAEPPPTAGRAAARGRAGGGADARRRHHAPVVAPFEVHLDVFSGPFDLLLGLISKHKLDITEVALAKVTDEFVAHIKAAQATDSDWDLGQASEFLLVAATLLDLKASRLLPSAGTAGRRGPRPHRGPRPALRPAAAVPRLQGDRQHLPRADGDGRAHHAAPGRPRAASSRSCCPSSSSP